MKQLNLILTSIAMLVGLFVLISILTDMDAEQTAPTEAMNDESADSVQTVSYTHLTLPTKA